MSIVSVIDKHIGAPKQGGARELVYVFTRIDRLGHIGYEPYLVRTLFPNFDRYYLITPTPEKRPIANRAIFETFSREMIWVPVDDEELDNYSHKNTYGNPNYGLFSVGSRVYALINETSLLTMMCAFVGGGGKLPKLDLTEEQKAIGRDLEISLGIKNNQPVATLHVREHNPNRHFDHLAQSFNANISNYKEAIRHLIDRGYAVVRLGDKTMTPIGSSAGQLIDLPFHTLRSDFADLFFIWRSNFYLGTTSGPSTVAHTLGVQKLLVNCICVPATFIGPNDRVIYKTYFAKALDRNLRYRELVTSRNIDCTTDPEFEAAGIVLGENSAQDILTGVKEILRKDKLEHSCIAAKFRGIDWIAHSSRVMNRLDPPFFYPYVSGTLPCFDYFAVHPELMDPKDFSSVEEKKPNDFTGSGPTHLVPTANYSGREMPNWLEKFPDDFFHPMSSCEGIYQDRWIKALSRLSLPGGPADVLILRGMTPLLNDPSYVATLGIYVDGNAVNVSQLGLGEWEIRTPISDSRSVRTVELVFSKAQTLPMPDGRSVGALIKSVGLLSAMPV